jgi:iron complex outermembrane receptor protein
MDGFMTNRALEPLGRWRWVLMALAIQTACASAASTDDLLDMSLEELVDYRMMSMSRKEQRVADMAAAAYVISAEEIRRSGAQSIPEALRLVPGLNVAQISGDRWAVSSRGFNERLSNKLLVQVDGRSIYSPIFSGVLWETQDAIMGDIERIEVIRGPGAALWGNNAMNGVINIVTRSAAASQGSTLSATWTLGGGASSSLVHSGGLAQGGHFKVFGKASRTQGSPETDSGLQGADASRQQRLGIKIEPELARGQLSLKAEVYQYRSQDVWGFPSLPAFSDNGASLSRDALLSQNGDGLALIARYTWKSEQNFDNALQVSFDQDKISHTGLWGTGTRVGFARGEAPALQSPGGFKKEFDVDFQQRRKAGLHDVIWGLNLRHISDNLFMPATPFVLNEGKSQRVNYSAFVHDELTWVPDRFKLIVGSKFEKDGLTGYNVQPNVRALYTPSYSEAYWAAVSHSARSLRRFESLATIDVSAQDAHVFDPAIPPKFLTAVMQVSPLPGAQPVAEKALSLEAGWRKQFSNFLSVDATVFATDYRHLRGARLWGNPAAGLLHSEVLGCPYAYGPGVCYFTVQGYNSNQDRARSYGGEWSLEWHPRPWWTLQTWYSYLSVKGVRSGDWLGDLLVNVFENSAPRHQFSLTNNFGLGNDLNLNVRLRYQTETSHLKQISGDLTRLPPYTGLDMRLSWKASRQTELSLLGRNLLKDRHTEFISSFPVSRAYDVQRSLQLQLVTRF